MGPATGKRISLCLRSGNPLYRKDQETELNSEGWALRTRGLLTVALTLQLRAHLTSTKTPLVLFCEFLCLCVSHKTSIFLEPRDWESGKGKHFLNSQPEDRPYIKTIPTWILLWLGCEMPTPCPGHGLMCLITWSLADTSIWGRRNKFISSCSV